MSAPAARAAFAAQFEGRPVAPPERGGDAWWLHRDEVRTVRVVGPLGRGWTSVVFGGAVLPVETDRLVAWPTVDPDPRHA